MFERPVSCFAFGCSALLNLPQHESDGGGHDSAILVTEASTAGISLTPCFSAVQLARTRRNRFSGLQGGQQNR